MAVPASSQVLNALASSEVGAWSRQRAAETVSSLQIEELIDRIAKEFKKNAESNNNNNNAVSQSAPVDGAAAVASSLGDILCCVASGTCNATRKLFSTISSGFSSLLSSSEVPSALTESCSFNSNSDIPSFSLGAFNPQQEHFLSGLISSLHNEHVFNLTAAQKKTLMMCGITAFASVSLSALTWYVVSKYSDKKSSSTGTAPASDSSPASSGKMRIKNLTFQGTPEEFVKFMETVQQQQNGSGMTRQNNNKNNKNKKLEVAPLSIEIENACIVSASNNNNKQNNNNTNSLSDYDAEDSFFVHEGVRPPTPPLRPFNVYADLE